MVLKVFVGAVTAVSAFLSVSVFTIGWFTGVVRVGTAVVLG
jgi:hypothetical protein